MFPIIISHQELLKLLIDIAMKSKLCIFRSKSLFYSRNPIKSKGATSIGRFLKDVEELFIGGKKKKKEGFLALCRNCVKLKRLSLVAT